MKTLNEEKINIVLQSIEGIQKAAPQPFFFTRLSARLQDRQQQQANPWVKTSKIITRPAFAVAFVVVLFGLNAVLLFYYKSNNSIQPQSSSAEQYAANIANGTNFEEVNFFEK